MKRLFAGTCLAAVCAVGLSAQNPPAQPPAQQPSAQQPSAQSQAPKDEVTVTGCLRAGAQPNSFELTDVKWDKGAPTGTAGAAAGEKPTVRIIGSPAGAKLDEHVGHTVQLTGKLAPASSTAGTAGTPGAPGAAGSRPSGPSLNVQTMKMVSSSCESK